MEDDATKRHEIVMSAFEEVLKRLTAIEGRLSKIAGDVHALSMKGQGKSAYPSPDR